MDRKSTDRRLNPLLPLLLLGGLALSVPLNLAAQVPVDENGEPLEALDPFDYTQPTDQAAQPLTTTELEDLVGPIALYPDDLLAIVLPASTYPLEIVQAARFLDELGTDSSLEPDESWDESVIALLNYPEVVYMMDKEIDWTWRLGEAVINQQPDVLAAVESFRDRAYAAGNLQSDQHQTVSNDDGAIEIAPADEEIIYVPYYEPEDVVVYQPRRVYYYYPQAYPVYYYPYPVGYSFASGYFWGVTTAFAIGWPNHYLHVYHPSYWGHPYYGRQYYGHYYRRPSISVYNNWYVHDADRVSGHHERDGDRWQPGQLSGARPATQRVRNRHNRSGRRDDYRAANRPGNRVARESHDGNRTRMRANNDAGSRAGGSAHRVRPSNSHAGMRTAVANRDPQRRERGSNTEFRFRDRSDADRSSAGRQPPVARNSTRSPVRSRPSQDRQVNRRNAAPRQPRATRVSTRNTASQRTSAARPASRPSVQRQARAPRQASRPSVQRRAPAQRSAPAAAPHPQSSGRRAGTSAGRGHSRGRPQRQH